MLTALLPLLYSGAMTSQAARAALEFDQGQTYEIRIQGELDQRWSDWYGNSHISIESHEADGQTILRCQATDQARLRGMLNKIWDLNLCLISVRQVPSAGVKGQEPNG